MNDFLSNKTRGLWAIRIRYILFVSVLVTMASEFMEYRLLGRIATEEITPSLEQMAASNDTRQFVVSLIYLVTIISAGVLYLLWFRRAYNNLRAFNISLYYKSWWTIGGWMIPIACLFVPYKIMKEFHEKTAEILNSNGMEARFELVNCKIWWAAYLISNFADKLYTRLFSNADTIEAMQSSNILFIISGVISLITILLSIRVIKTYSIMENALYDGIHNEQICILKNDSICAEAINPDKMIE